MSWSLGKYCLAIVLTAVPSALPAAARVCAADENPPAQERSGTTTQAGGRFAGNLPLPGVANLAKVTPLLFRGAQPNELGFQNLQKVGIQVVVNFRPDNALAERKIVTGLGMQYFSIPWNCGHPTNQLVAEFLELLRDHPDEKVFVHCEHGVDRTGLMVATYRMGRQGWTPQQALAEMESYGFNFIHRSYCRGLKPYEQNFPAQLTKDARLRALRALETPSSAPQQ